ncbi:MAG: 16S rRNA (guanine(966)-N(2))-methyltransferase RsmD [Verrucomicrobiota bacterium]
MRIITGIAGGLRLEVPKTLARPTTDRVREAIFSSLGDRVIGAKVLDLFAGSGALGLEALSRGAASADLIEADSKTCDVIRRNLDTTHLSGGRVRRERVESFLSRPAPEIGYDLIFADPPYARDAETSELISDFLSHPALPSFLAEEGLLLVESFAQRDLPASESLERIRSKQYGQSQVSVFSRLNS